MPKNQLDMNLPGYVLATLIGECREISILDNEGDEVKSFWCPMRLRPDNRFLTELFAHQLVGHKILLKDPCLNIPETLKGFCK